MQRIALTILEMHYKDTHAGCLQLPVYRDDGSYSHMITIREHIPLNGPDFYREIDIPDGEHIGTPLVTGVCEYRLEDATPAPVRLEPEPRNYWKEQAMGATADLNAARAALSDVKTWRDGYAAIALIGWALVIALTAGVI